MRILALSILSASIVPVGAETIDFEKEILPILQDNCLECHGPEQQKSKFRVDQRAVMLNGGDSGIAALVPGNSEKSYLIELVKGLDPDMVMPPKGDPLSKEEVALLEKWIQNGASWPGQMNSKVELKTDHWSFQPVVRPEIPGDELNPIDSFINVKLHDAGLEPNSMADARSLLRRVSVVLTGLPPTPEEVEQFKKAYTADPANAYEATVERLLASEHFGERWAQHWLDVIRWSETNGSESNLYRKNAWIYRDYVIRAFNRDVPYDRFIREQIAGDQLGAGDATGFLVAGPHVPAATVGREPSAIRQARADRMDEIMQTVGASMLGVTVSCARCHNHKFDPISIRDYYALTAVFQGVEFGGRYPEFDEGHPSMQRAKDLRSQMWKERKQLRDGIGCWQENWGGFVDFHFEPFNTQVLRVEFDRPSIGIDELQVFGPDDYNENFALASEGTRLLEDEELADIRNPIKNANDGKFGTMAWRTRGAKGGKKKAWVEIHFSEARKINRFRFSSNREYYFETDFLESKGNFNYPGYRLLAKTDDGEWKPLGGTWKVDQVLEQKAELKEASDRLHKLIGEINDIGPRHSFIGQFTSKPTLTYVLHRGSPESPRDEVQPAGFEIMGGDLGLDSSATDAERRESFAEWLAHEEHPLTARVMVNRLWHHTFGSGIVPTTSDFGSAGAQPSHPELLDWLAAEFVEPTRDNAKPWSMKSIIRLMVMSDAFQRSSSPVPKGLEVDANSILLWRFPPRRVEAEVIRDGILQASGKLDRTIGGRSYRIHNVKKTYAQWEVVKNHGPETWRRMIYQERMRRVDDRIFTAFDFPDCGQVRAKRPVSTTPLQALNLMNSQFVVNQSKFISERARTEAVDEPGSIKRAFQLILGREPSPDELAACTEISAQNGLEIICRSLINSNEFVFLP